MKYDKRLTLLIKHIEQTPIRPAIRSFCELNGLARGLLKKGWRAPKKRGK